MPSLRQLNRRIFALNKEVVHKLNKLDACLQHCNIRISNYVSSIDSKSYNGVVDYLCEGITAPVEFVKKIHGRTINRVVSDIIMVSLTGVANTTDMDVLRPLREELALVEKHSVECQRRMYELSQEHFCA